MKKLLLASLLVSTMTARAQDNNRRHLDNNRDKYDRAFCICCTVTMFLAGLPNPNPYRTALAAPGSVSNPGGPEPLVCIEGEPYGDYVSCGDWYSVNWCRNSSNSWVDTFNSSSGCQNQSCPPLSSLAQEIEPRGIYTHTPTGREYKVDSRGIARHRKTCDEYVLYGIAGSEKLFRAMPVKEFTSNVTVNGQRQPAFKHKKDKDKQKKE